MSRTFKLGGREVEVDSVQHGADPVDSFVGSAYFVASGLPCSLVVLEELTDQLQQMGWMDVDWNDEQCSRAEAWAEGDR